MSGPAVQWYVRLASGTKCGAAESPDRAWARAISGYYTEDLAGATLCRVTRRKSEARKALHAAAEAWAMTTNASDEGPAHDALENAAEAWRATIAKAKL